jgi:hypothetical protein
MTLVIQKPTGAKLNLRQTWQPMDADAAAYITAVETADGQALEERTKIAIDNFVLGCKADGIWNAIKASCILAGARTLAGALTPLAGTAPTNVNFVSGDYNRKTGLDGNGTNKYINTNRAGNADPQNNGHISVVLGSSIGSVKAPIGSLASSPNRFSQILGENSGTISYAFQATGGVSIAGNAGGFYGISRSNSTQISVRRSSQTLTNSLDSTAISTEPYFVFARNLDGAPSLYYPDRISFYSIGESLNLALLDTRVTALITAFGAAIP